MFLYKVNLASNKNQNYSFKSLPFFEEEDSKLILCDNFLMDEYDEEFTNDPFHKDEGSVSILTTEEIKNMKRP